MTHRCPSDRQPALVARWLPVALALSALLAPALASAQAVPTKLRIPIIFKALTYDRNLAKGRAGALKIGVMWIKGNGASEREAKQTIGEITKAQGRKVGGLTLSVTPMPIQGKADAASAVAKAGVNLLYLSSMDGGVVGAVGAACRTKGILVVSGDAEHVKKGAALAVALQGGKPRIFVHLGAARAQKADFDARLLRLAQVTQ